MSTHITCPVDTHPMANELSSVSRHVSGTTAAVVTMQSAVIAAENAGANKVCANVNRGFLTMMRSQISQKIASKQARVEALLIKLGQQKRMLFGIKNNMEREYGRIAARYLRIFTSINKELEQRIRQLDQPVFTLVNRHMATSTNRMHALSSWMTTSQTEDVALSQQILMSNMKHNAQEALERSTDFLSQIGHQRVLANHILISNAEGNDDRGCYVPVIISESVTDSSLLTRTEIRTAGEMPQVCADSIVNSVRAVADLGWQERPKDANVSGEFNRLVDTSAASDRVKAMIRKLYAETDYNSI